MKKTNPMTVKRNISGVVYDVISPSYYVRHEPTMRILIGYIGGGQWCTWINSQPLGIDQTLTAAGDAIAAGLHSSIPKKVQLDFETHSDVRPGYGYDKSEVLFTVTHPTTPEAS